MQRHDSGKITTTLRFDPELYDAMRKFAKKEYRTLTSIVNQAVELYLGMEEIKYGRHNRI